MRILAGDIGGTNARLAIYDVAGTEAQLEVQSSYDSRSFESLVDVARTFMAEHELSVVTACFGVPGPVNGRRAKITNLPWEIDADELERKLGMDRVFLVNDLEASARGLATLRDSDLRELRPAIAGATGNAALVAAGTGLGEAGLYWDGRRHRPFACEGGHTDFSPANEREDALLRWLRARIGGHVSWERVLSGPGLGQLYAFLREDNPGAEPKWLAEELAAGDVPEVVSRNALEEKSDLCAAALDWFMALYGAEAGNVALKVLATGGVYLGGGIAPKIARALPGSDFVARFDGKGRMRPLLERIGIRVIMNEHVALQGAAYYAAREAHGDHG
jgi:glucokinase